MDSSNIEESSPSKAENMNSSGSEASGSSLPGDLDSSDAQDIGSSGDEESSASSKASSVIRFSGPARRQNWSLPDSIIFYMAKNPSTPKLYQKLIRTCKYFFLVNPIVICSGLELRYREDTAEEETGNGNEADKKGAVKDTHDYWQITQNLVKKNVWFGERNKEIDLKNYSAKVWIVGMFYCGHTSFLMHHLVSNRNIVSSIIPKIYRCNIKHLQLRRQNLSFTQFSFLATSAVNIWLEKFTVKYDDGTVVPVEKIVECATKAQLFNHIDLDDNGASISSETVKNFLKIPHFSNLKTLELDNIPGSFDIETLFTYLKKHKSTSFCFRFSEPISAAYKKRLEKIVDEILVAGGRRRYKSPLIVFPGLDQAKLEKMYKYYHPEAGYDL